MFKHEQRELKMSCFQYEVKETLHSLQDSSFMESKSHRVGGPTIGQVAQMPRAQLGTIEILAVVQVKIRFKQKKPNPKPCAEETRVGWIFYF